MASGNNSGGEHPGGNGDLLYRLGVTPLIAAGGPNTMHSGTRPRPEVLEAMVKMTEQFVRLDEFIIAAGQEIADMIGVPAATITSGASGGLVLQAAAAIAKDDPKAIAQLPNTDGLANELIIQRGHRFGYDQLYLVAGSKFVEVGTPESCTREEIIEAIGPNTAGIIHLESADREEGFVLLEDTIEIAHSHDLPLLLDAASSLPPRENLTKFVNMGVDLVSFSGGKAVRSIQSTGMLLGKPKWVEYARLNNAPNSTVARAQKVSKEEIAGLLTAIKSFLAVDEEEEMANYRRDMQVIVDQVAEVPGVTASVQHEPGAFYRLPHAVIEFGESWKGPDSTFMGHAFLAGNPRIYLRFGHSFLNGIAIDPLNIQPGELEIVAETVRATLVRASSGDQLAN